MQPVCIPNKPLLGSCLSERVRCTGIKMAQSEYDKLKDAHDAIADGDHPAEFAEAFTNWSSFTTGQLKAILESEGLTVDRQPYDRAVRLLLTATPYPADDHAAYKMRGGLSEPPGMRKRTTPTTSGRHLPPR